MKTTGISVRSLAKKCGLDSSFLSKVLNGKRNPPSDEKTIIHIASIIGEDPDYMMFSCGRIPAKWQKFFLRKDIHSILAKIDSAKTDQIETTHRKSGPKSSGVKYTAPNLPDEIL